MALLVVVSVFAHVLSSVISTVNALFRLFGVGDELGGVRGGH